MRLKFKLTAGEEFEFDGDGDPIPFLNIFLNSTAAAAQKKVDAATERLRASSDDLEKSTHDSTPTTPERT